MKSIFIFALLLFSQFKIISGNETAPLNDSTRYLQLTTLQADYLPSLDSLLNNNSLKYLIIDLRDNHGGSLADVVLFLERLLPKKSLAVIIWDKNNNPREFYTHVPPLISKKVKIAIIVNRKTAASAEIIAGCLQDLDRAIVVGDTTFGNGSILDNNNNIIGRAALPSGRFIDRGVKSMKYQTLTGREVVSGYGIIPDYTIEVHQPDSIVMGKSLDLLLLNESKKNGHRAKKKK